MIRRFFEWLRRKLYGPRDVEIVATSQEISEEQSRLNGAVENLSKSVENLRARKNDPMAVLLDDTLKAVKKEGQR